jgi:hypothetical protein
MSEQLTPAELNPFDRFLVEAACRGAWKRVTEHPIVSQFVGNDPAFIGICESMHGLGFQAGVIYAADATTKLIQAARETKAAAAAAAAPVSAEPMSEPS